MTGQRGIAQATMVAGDLASFSFHQDPVLVIENFWSLEERQFFREGMQRAVWKHLSDLPHVRDDFPNSGNWAKADIGPAEGQRFLEKLQLSCIHTYIESFPNIVRRHLGFSYYSYAAGDCLLTHDDTDQGQLKEGRRAPQRRLALVTYLHEEWNPDWGGELIIYERRDDRSARRDNLVPTHCIAPRPGSLVLFTVPRFHRVCRVDQTAVQHRRLSIAGWFMTEHA